MRGRKEVVPGCVRHSIIGQLWRECSSGRAMVEKIDATFENDARSMPVDTDELIWSCCGWEKGDVMLRG